MVSLKIASARLTAHAFRAQADRMLELQEARQARYYNSRGAAALQKCFEGIPVHCYTEPGVVALTEEIAGWRKSNIAAYQQAGDLRNGGYELRHLAFMQESLVRKPHRAQLCSLGPIDNRYLLMVEAIAHRQEAISCFRAGEQRLELAFELSYLSHTLRFMVDHYQPFQTETVRDELISYLSEAGPILEQFGNYRDAFYEYSELACLLVKKAKFDPAVYRRLVDVALLGRTAFERAKLAETIDLRARKMWLERQIRVCDFGSKACRQLRKTVASDPDEFTRLGALKREFDVQASELRQQRQLLSPPVG
ncbi:MAG: hypothetical protein MUC35_04365 [Candidatus Margulisbacteria bacterium]|jgi:hypothetical protein|nr:hypothetical protein [Candidatus Margulisiibacteriota bacterium]